MDKPAYDIENEPLFPLATRIDVKALADAQTPWWNRALTAVNDTVVRLSVLDGDFHWHKHDDEDEFFFVLEGRLDLEFEDRTVTLDPGHGYTVPRGVMHFPHARGRTVTLVVEKASANPVGS